MASKIKVDQIEGQSGTTVTLPSGQTLDLSSGSVTLPNNAVDLSSAKVTGTLGSSNLPTIPVTKEYVEMFNKYVGENSTGTLVLLRDLDRLNSKVTGNSKTSVIKYISKIINSDEKS